MHHHDVDEAYDSVILHVVNNDNAVIHRKDGQPIPQCVLRYPQPIEAQYQAWQHNPQRIVCSDSIGCVGRLFITGWLNALLVERLHERTSSVESHIDQNRGGWEEAFYIMLARSFGFHTNGLPFELTARSLPLSYIDKHRSSLFQIEALLFGQAGLLEHPCDDYSSQLKQEYDFLRIKFGLTPIDGSQWKMLRMRPLNFPHIRLAQLSALLHRSSHLFGNIVEHPDYDSLLRLFTIEATGYWRTHYRFGTSCISRDMRLGTSSIHSLLINAVAPCLFVYGRHHSNEQLSQQALQLMESIPPERNSIVSHWHSLGIEAHSAADTQALLQLYNQYCAHKRCLHCRIGHQVLAHIH